MTQISLIMPVYNEEKFLDACLIALMKQTLKPAQIVVVDDGSTDESPGIIAKYPVTTVKLPKEKQASLERYPYVLSAGSKFLSEEFDYVGIIDADTIVEPEYYEKLVRRMEDDKSIGIAGGDLLGEHSTGPILGLIPYVYGSNRLYTKTCWLKINEGRIMKPVPQCDFYHNVYAQMLGFKTKKFDEIKSWHLRPRRMGNAFLRGFHAYELGYYWYYLFLRALMNLAPDMISGYLKARFSGRPEYPVKPYVRKLQVYRLRRLILRKHHNQ